MLWRWGYWFAAGPGQSGSGWRRRSPPGDGAACAGAAGLRKTGEYARRRVPRREFKTDDAVEQARVDNTFHAWTTRDWLSRTRSTAGPISSWRMTR